MNPAQSAYLRPNSQEPARYSLTWANSVVDRLIRKYPRASEFVLRSLDISVKTMSLYLSRNDPIFPAIRDLIHSCDIYLQIHGNASWYSWDDYIYGRLTFVYAGNQRDRLAKRLEEIHNRRAGFKGREGEGRTRPDPSQPLLFPELA